MTGFLKNHIMNSLLILFVRFEIRPKRKFWEIINKRWLQRYYPSFHDIEKKLNEVGWSTFDLG